jgi:hypothetical protein
MILQGKSIGIFLIIAILQYSLDLMDFFIDRRPPQLKPLWRHDCLIDDILRIHFIDQTQEIA